MFFSRQMSPIPSDRMSSKSVVRSNCPLKRGSPAGGSAGFFWHPHETFRRVRPAPCRRGRSRRSIVPTAPLAPRQTAKMRPVGLRVEILEFPADLPSLDDIRSHLGSDADAISFRGTLEVTPDDEEQARSTPPPRTSILLRTNDVTCCYRSELAKKRRGITYVKIFASLHGGEMELLGNNNRLMDTLVAALLICGGKRKARPQKDGASRDVARPPR